MITLKDIKRINSPEDIVIPKNMRDIFYLVIHATAGPQNQSTQEILNYWSKVNKWNNPGYHFETNADGTIEQLISLDKIANGVAGHNSKSIHISYKGGIDSKGRPVDNRTDAQKKSLEILIKFLQSHFPKAYILGHREFSTDTNKNGIIDTWEYIKSCPCFEVQPWLKEIGVKNTPKPKGIV